MKRSSRWFIPVWIGLVHAGAVDVLAGSTYEIDPAQTSIVFKVKNRDISFVFGRFNKITGTIGVDRVRDPTRFNFKIEIESRSVDTNNKKRDRHLTSSEFFKARKHPTITFENRNTKMVETGKFEITGKLDFLGEKRDLTFIFELIAVKKISDTEYRLGGQSTFTIKRSEFGLGAMIPEIADEVTVMVNIEAKFVMLPVG